MVLSTRASTVDPYIVVLDGTTDSTRALLFDAGARRVEGFAAQLPRSSAAAGSDCLDEMHRLVLAAKFHIAAVVGRAESEVTAEDRGFWPAFAGAEWFPSLPESAGAILGIGCVGRWGLIIGEKSVGEKSVGEKSVLGVVVESPVTADGLMCAEIDQTGWLVSAAVPEAGSAYASLRQTMKGSMEEILDRAGADDARLAPIHAVSRRLRAVFLALSRMVGPPAEVIACGAALLRSPAFTQRIADALGVPLTLSTEAEPAGRGAALWALKRIGAIEDLRALPASTGAVFTPIYLETTK